MHKVSLGKARTCSHWQYPRKENVQKARGGTQGFSTINQRNAGGNHTGAAGKRARESREGGHGIPRTGMSMGINSRDSL